MQDSVVGGRSLKTQAFQQTGAAALRLRAVASIRANSPNCCIWSSSQQGLACEYVITLMDSRGNLADDDRVATGAQKLTAILDPCLLEILHS
jgi:hypothetical protein